MLSRKTIELYLRGELDLSQIEFANEAECAQLKAAAQADLESKQELIEAGEPFEELLVDSYLRTLI